MSQKLKIRITFFVGLVSWLLFTFFDIYAILLQRYKMQEDLATSLPQAFLTLFILATLFYYRYKVTKAESVNFIDLLWKVFVTGLVTTLISLTIQGCQVGTSAQKSDDIIKFREGMHQVKG